MGARSHPHCTPRLLRPRSEGCVLVIDEAYGLDPNGGGGFVSPGGGGTGGDPFKTAVIDTLVSRVQGDAGADRSARRAPVST